MATVRSLDVNLGLNTAAFTAGRKSASKGAQDLASDMATRMGVVSGLVSGGVGVAFDLIKGLASSAIGAVSSAVGSIKGQISQVGDIQDLMVATGLSADLITSVGVAAKLAGSDQAAFNDQLGKFTKTLAEAKNGSATAQAALAGVGITLDDLSSKTPDQLFNKMVDGVSSMDDPLRKANVAIDLFGKGGLEAVKWLDKGSIAAGVKDAQAFGLAMTAVDARQMDAAGDAMDRVGMLVDGLQRQIALHLSPFIEAAANHLVEFGVSGGSASEWVIWGLEKVVGSVAYLADFISLLKGSWNDVSWAINTANGFILLGIDALGSGWVKLINLLPGVEIEWTNTIKKASDVMFAEADKANKAASKAYRDWNEGTNQAAVKKWFGDVEKASKDAAASVANNPISPAVHPNAIEQVKKVTDELGKLRMSVASMGTSEDQKKILDLKAMGAGPEQLAEAQRLIDQLGQAEGIKRTTDELDRLRKSVATIGLIEDQKKLFDLRAMGASPEQIAEAQRLIDQLGQSKHLTDLEKQAETIRKGLQTPLDVLNEQKGKTDELFARGLLSAEEYEAQLAKLKTDFDGKTQDQKDDFSNKLATTAEQRFAVVVNNDQGGIPRQQLTAAQTTAKKVGELVALLKGKAVELVGIEGAI